jgi:hypothetical protein
LQSTLTVTAHSRLPSQSSLLPARWTRGSIVAQPVASKHASSAPHKARIDIGLSGGSIGAALSRNST